VTEEMSTV